MTHALEILEERRYELRKLIRTCKENSDRIMHGVGDPNYAAQLADIEDAIARLKKDVV